MSAATMRAAVYHGAKDVRVEQRPVPTAGPDQVLVRGDPFGHLRHRRHGVPARAG